MALACQRNSYLKELNTTVVSCSEAKVEVLEEGKKKKIDCFDVVLEDTILFPEGGGQPDDRGTIAEHAVLQVRRQGADAHHFILDAIEPGSKVKVEVDWRRRWDHMQQHSGQHLVTAIADSLYGYATTSWNLGEKVSTIELDTKSITSEQLSTIEDTVNEKIRAQVKMYPTLYDSVEDPALKLVRTRGLPDDHVGVVRVVTIEGVENNMCCGTHVSCLSHLQAIKILGTEVKKGKVNLIFIAGQRVMTFVEKSYEKDRQLTALLKGGTEQHVELLDKLQKSYRVASKNATTLLRESAIMEAKIFKLTPDRDQLFILHKKEGDNDFMNILVKEIGQSARLIFVTVGDERGSGLFMLCGSETDISAVKSQVAELLDAKGAGKGGRFQGKANKLQKRPEVIQVLKNYLSAMPLP